MPYKRLGRNVMHKKDGWSRKAKAKSAASAQRQINLLRGIEHGDWQPTGRPARDRRAIFSAKSPPRKRKKK